MGDSIFWERMKGLRAGPHPLIEWNLVERPQRLPDGEVRITETGLAVIEGRADWIELNGIDRWLGGVHLKGSEAAWRWDEQAAALRENHKDTKSTKKR